MKIIPSRPFGRENCFRPKKQRATKIALFSLQEEPEANLLTPTFWVPLKSLVYNGSIDLCGKSVASKLRPQQADWLFHKVTHKLVNICIFKERAVSERVFLGNCLDAKLSGCQIVRIIIVMSSCLLYPLGIKLFIYFIIQDLSEQKLFGNSCFRVISGPWNNLWGQMGDSDVYHRVWAPHPTHIILNNIYVFTKIAT